jgi:hypothetical protein
MSKHHLFKSKRFVVTQLLSIFLIISPPLSVLAGVSTKTSYSISAVDYAQNELIKAGWRENVAKAVVNLNSAWFTLLNKAHQNDFHRQIKLLKQLKMSAIVSRFLRKHPETAGLLAISDHPIFLVKMLNQSSCYHVISYFYALHTTPTEIQLLTEALDKHGDLMCELTERGLLATQTVFMFPRDSKGAKEYDAWLEEVFSKYLWHSDQKVAEIMGFLIEQGPSIRQRLEKESDFYQKFRKELWPALIRVADDFKAFEWLANDPHIWDLLALPEGEILLEKWGLGPITLLFGEGSYPTEMRSIIIQILLQGDDNTVDALFRYKDEPLFRHLLRRELSASTQAALANQLANVCPNYPEQSCPALHQHLRYFASINGDAALAEEVGPTPSGPVTWIPLHGSYYAIKKMRQGRDINSDDILNLSLDALILVPSGLLVYAFSGAAQPIAKEMVFDIGIKGLETLAFTPRTHHVVKSLGKFAIRAGNNTGKLVAQQLAHEMIQQVAILQGKQMIVQGAATQVSAFMKQSQHILSQLGRSITKKMSYDVTEPIKFIHGKTGKGQHAVRILEFDAQVFMRHDAKILMAPTHGLNHQFFRETAEIALLTPTTRHSKEISAWQQNISAWWLMNAAIAY